MGSVERVSHIIGTAGHIDHGKTALVAAMTGMDTDRLDEEKRRGVSIDLGFAYIDLRVSDRVVRAAVVDVPGHERFIRNMLAGTTGVDLVLFVVAADDGVMPQTREHLDIVRLLGITDVIFVITKTDLADGERISRVEADIRGLVAGTAIEGAPVVRVSALTGEGIDELKALVGSRLGTGGRVSEGWFRLPVDRSFAVKGFGAVVTGTVASGSARVGDELIVFPSARRVRVRGVQSLHADCKSVGAGERAAINLSGISHNDIRRGDMLSSTVLARYIDAAVQNPPMRVDCRVEFVTQTHHPGDRERVIKNHSTLKLHHMTGESVARVVFSGVKAARPGDQLAARLVLAEPLLMLRGDRFVLRDPSDNTTVGGGRVVLPELSRRHMPPVERLRAVFEASGDDAATLLAAFLESTGAPGMDIPIAALMFNVAEDDIARMGGQDARSGLAIAGGFVVRTDAVAVITDEVTELVRRYHADNPAEPGMEGPSILKAYAGESRLRAADSALVTELIGRAVKAGVLKKDGAIYSLPTHATMLTGIDAEVERALTPLFDRGFRAVNADDFRDLPFTRADIDRVLAHLVKTGRVRRLKEGSFLSAGAVAEAQQKLVATLKTRGSITAREYRDVLGTGRKLAIELLEYFDAARVTLRRGDERTLR